MRYKFLTNSLFACQIFPFDGRPCLATWCFLYLFISSRDGSEIKSQNKQKNKKLENDTHFICPHCRAIKIGRFFISDGRKGARIKKQSKEKSFVDRQPPFSLFHAARLPKYGTKWITFRRPSLVFAISHADGFVDQNNNEIEIIDFPTRK